MGSRPDHLSCWLVLPLTLCESDRAAGLGQPSDDCVFGDASALYLHWEHKGNFRTALAAIELPEGWADVEKI
jgi:hypothetical protein